MDSRGNVRRTGPTGREAGVGIGWVSRLVRGVGPHPSLWPVALRQSMRLAAPGWWRRRPFLPLPPAGYLRFRLQTAYGGNGDRPPDPDDLLAYLRWCRDMRV